MCLQNNVNAFLKVAKHNNKGLLIKKKSTIINFISMKKPNFYVFAKQRQIDVVTSTSLLVQHRIIFIDYIIFHHHFMYNMF